jgi:hypothetical protein
MCELTWLILLLHRTSLQNNAELRLARLAEAKEHRTQQLFGSGAESRFLAKLKGLLPNFRP